MRGGPAYTSRYDRSRFWGPRQARGDLLLVDDRGVGPHRGGSFMDPRRGSGSSSRRCSWQLVVIVILNPFVTWIQARGVPRIARNALRIHRLPRCRCAGGPRRPPERRRAGAQDSWRRSPSCTTTPLRTPSQLLESLGFENVTVWSYDQIVDYLNDPDESRHDRLDRTRSGSDRSRPASSSSSSSSSSGPVLAFYFLIDLPNVQRPPPRRVPGTTSSRGRPRGEPAEHRPREDSSGASSSWRLIVGIMLSFGYWLDRAWSSISSSG